jgi:hypothetical protein
MERAAQALPKEPRSEPNLGRHSASIRSLTLVLTTLLAWPWNVVLSRAESLQIASQVRVSSLRTQPNPGVKRPARYRLLDQQSCSLDAPDFDRDEQEWDDDGSPAAPDWSPVPIATLEWTTVAPCCVATGGLPAGPGPRIHFCCLRC